MKKQLFFCAMAFCMAISAFAIPAKRGIWKTITTKDGKQIKAELVGDEHLHYLRTTNGEAYIEKGGVATLLTTAQLDSMRTVAASKRVQVNRIRRIGSNATSTGITGAKKGLIILVQFPNQKFAANHDSTLYYNIANTPGYSENGFRGSVSDYFKDQSDGKFQIHFDVVGPVTVSMDYSYYGRNDYYTNFDNNPAQMIAEACELADPYVNFQDYDWDGDGTAEEVYVIYAGHGENDYYDKNKNVIWPHMSKLTGTSYQGLTLDNTMINVYACSNEIDRNNVIAGIGTICHEFSHCLGYPDLYDTQDSKRGPGSYDIMAGGSYNGESSNGEGSGYCPAGYTSYEKITAGWITPVELGKADTTITALKPTSDGGDAYIIYNSGYKNEYYLVENRQQTHWDTDLPGSGIMITHVDYDASVWQDNTVNVSSSHQYLSYFPADNSYDNYTESTDLYPYGSNNSLTATSTPAASLFHANAKGDKTSEYSINDMKIDSNGLASFSFKAATDTNDDNDSDTTVTTGTLLYESFNKCDGTGGNDNKWSGSVGSGTVVTDLTGWQFGYAGKANCCVKVGSSTTGSCYAITPSFKLNGDAVLTFYAGGWGNANDGTTLTVSLLKNSSETGTVSPATLTLVKKQFNLYTVKLSAKGTVNVEFKADGRFFLDEVKVESAASTGINAINSKANTSNAVRIYNLQGVYVGTDLQTLAHGIYIVNGKKVVR